jgi:hypothetical protein
MTRSMLLVTVFAGCSPDPAIAPDGTVPALPASADGADGTWVGTCTPADADGYDVPDLELGLELDEDDELVDGTGWLGTASDPDDAVELGVAGTFVEGRLELSLFFADPDATVDWSADFVGEPAEDVLDGDLLTEGYGEVWTAPCALVRD